MAIPESFLDELNGRSDIAEIVGDYVKLSKRGGSNLFGLCPFHSEKTPSFSVSTDRQIYHCFGCGKGGGAINFIMEIENLSFPDAVEVLAKRAGMTVPESGTSPELTGQRKRMYEINRDAARFFHDALSTPQGSSAVRYIEKRGISKSAVTRFGLGAAPDSWTSLIDAMTAKGYTTRELIDAGLAKNNRNGGGGVYDAFRDRLMFPVIDVRGNVIGFSGRMLSDGEPKYLNSPETLVFNKSRNLFALNIAKKSKSGMLILSEGNIDVVALHQAGFDCAVASLGTSLTEEQARLMARYTENVVIAFDGDAAGVKASDRAITILDRAGLGVKVLRMRDAKDPDEFIQKFGADAFRRLLTESENHIAYRLLEIQSKSDLKSDEGRLEYFGTATKLLSELGNSAEREVYGRRVAAAAGVSFEAVEAEVKKLIKARRSSDNKKRRREELNPIAAMQPTDRSLRYENGYSAIAEEGVIGYLIADPSLIKTARAQGLDEGEFTSELLRKVYAWLLRRDSEDADVRLTTLLSVLEKPEAARITQIVQRPLSTPNGEKAIADYIGKIRTERLKSKPASTDDLMEMRRRYKETKGLEGEINGL